MPTFETTAEAASLLCRSGHWIARGLGKSYGDNALNRQVLSTRRFNKLLRFDTGIGVVTCESNVTLSDLIDVFLPKGWFWRWIMVVIRSIPECILKRLSL
jgi:decaprenylphospho-beta-D-ribofuranose 2-oxidase